MNGSNKSTVRIQPTDSAATKAQNGNGPVPGVNICVVGAGFVGLVTAAGFADFGHNVVCVEKDPRRLDLLQSGRLPFYERDLQELITTNVANSRLSFSADLPDALDNQRAIFIAVGTPASSTGRTDLGALEEVTDALNDHVTDNQIVVIKSTAPIGAAGRLKNKLNGRSDRRTPVISNPEFLREGSAVYDFFNPQRIVIGGDDPEAVEVITHIHRLGMKKQAPFVITNNETAEMIKYASNVFLATKIGLVNEIAAVCDPLQVNVVEVARGMGLDPRIGADFLNPGPGWGGSCLPKDISEFQGLAKSVGVETNIAHAVTVANQRHQERIAEKVQRMLDGLEDKNIAALGMAFKADTSDTRNSPALAVIKLLLDGGANVTAFDPAVTETTDGVAGLSGLKVAASAEAACAGADCLILLTEWREFQMLDWENIGETMTARNIVDARNLLSPESMRRAGFTYTSVGQY